MKLAIEIGGAQPDKLDLTTQWVQLAERLGVDMAFSAEAWWSDAVTPLGYLADKTDKTIHVEIHSFDPKSKAKSTRIRRAYESEIISSRTPKFNVRP